MVGHACEGPSPFPGFADVPGNKSKAHTSGLIRARFALVPCESVAAGTLAGLPSGRKHAGTQIAVAPVADNEYDGRVVDFTGDA